MAEARPTPPLDRHPDLRKGLRVVQLVTAALLAGVVILLVVFHVVRGVWVGAAGTTTGATREISLSLVLGIVAVVQVPVFFIVRAALLASARGRIAAAPRGEGSGEGPFGGAGDAGRLFHAWTTSHVVLAAGLEGAALLCGVAYLLEGSSVVLVMAGALVLLLAMQMPRRRSVDAWLEQELEVLSRTRR